jgi:pimeloyl-ACP methyl ester carboxylesterase
VLSFAARYPDQVAGMVLVDSTAPAATTNPATPSPGHGGSDAAMRRVSALVSTAARLGLGRLHGQFAIGSLPPRSREEVRASDATASTLRSTPTSTSRRRPRWSKLPPCMTSPTSP